MTSIQQLSTQSDNDWNEIIKYAARNSDPEHKISDKLLDFMEKDWKIWYVYIFNSFKEG